VAITDPTLPNGGSAEVGGSRTFPQHGIDLPNIAFGAQTTLAYAGNEAGTGGTLLVGDGRHAAAIALHGRKLRHRRGWPWWDADFGSAAGRTAAAAGAAAWVMLVALRRRRGLHRFGHLGAWHIRHCHVRIRCFGLRQQV
jgi:hypothetical protein